MGYTFSTPTPEATRRTVKVPPASVPCLRASTKPSNACRRVLPFSSIFCQTRTVSPGRRSRFLRASMSTGETLTAFFMSRHYTIGGVRKQLFCARYVIWSNRGERHVRGKVFYIHLVSILPVEFLPRCYIHQQ